MLGGERFQKLSHCSALSALRLFQPATDAADVVEEFAVVKEPLISLGALHNDLSLAVPWGTPKTRH